MELCTNAKPRVQLETILLVLPLRTLLLTAFLIFQAIRIGSVVPTGVSHTASRACKFQGYDIPEGVIVMPYVASAQHDPSAFPEPHQFRPERFLDDAGNLKMPVKYNPFGMGKLISITRL